MQSFAVHAHGLGLGLMLGLGDHFDPIATRDKAGSCRCLAWDCGTDALD
jgi:hypothetical protein